MSKTFQDFVREKAGEQSHVERRKRRDQWVAAVERLLDQMIAWLKAADPDGLLEVIVGETDIWESALGRYKVKMLTIQLGKSTVQVTPVAGAVLGPANRKGGERRNADGLVHVRGGIDSQSLYLFHENGDDHWFVANNRHELEPLDQSHFEALVQELLS